MYTFFQSPPNITSEILLKLNPAGLGKLRIVCKTFKDQVDKTPGLWQRFLQDNTTQKTSTTCSANSSETIYKELYINYPELRKSNFLCYDLKGISYLFTQIIFMQERDNWKGNRIFKNLLPGIISLILASQLTIEEAVSLSDPDAAERLHNAAPLIKQGVLSIANALKIDDQISIMRIASSSGLLFYLANGFYTLDELLPLQYKQYAYLEAHVNGLKQQQFTFEAIKSGLLTLKPLFTAEEPKAKPLNPVTNTPPTQRTGSSFSNTPITRRIISLSFDPVQSILNTLANNLTFQKIAAGFDVRLLAAKDFANKVQVKSANSKCNTLYALEYLALLIDHKVLKVEEIQPIITSLKKDEGIVMQPVNKNYVYR